MKDFIVIVASIILAVILFTMIIGDTGTLESEARTIFSDVTTELGKVEP